MADIEHLRFMPDDPELCAGLDAMAGPLPEEGTVQDLVDRLAPYTHDNSQDIINRINHYGFGREIKMASRILDWYGYSVQPAGSTPQP